MIEGDISARQRRRRLIIIGALWAFIAIVLVVFREVVLPFIIAGLIAYIIAPLVRRLTGLGVGKRSLPRWSAILIVYAAFFLAVYLFLIALVPQLYRELARVSGNAVQFANSLTPRRVEELTERAERWLGDRGIPVSLSQRSLEGEMEDGTQGPPPALSINVQHELDDEAKKLAPAIKEHLGSVVDISRKLIAGIIVALSTLALMLMLAAFLTVDAEKIRSYGRSLIPPELASDARALIERIDRSLAGVVRGQLTICLVNGALTLLGLVIFGVKFAFLLATVAAIFSLIPIFGSVLSSVPIVLVALTQSWKKAIAMLVWIVGVHQIEALFLNPKIMGTAARIHPIVMAFALIAGERSFGLIGALLAPPLAAVVVACFEYLREKAQPAEAQAAIAARAQ